MKKVVFIAGTAYCGSSLLNLLLDSQSPGIRGLGERSQTDSETGGPCAVCNAAVKDCRHYSLWDGSRFYEYNFNYYGCGALVDSSKRTDILLRAVAEEPQFDYFVLHASKTPHAAVHSIIKHWQHDTWDAPLPGARRDIAAALDIWTATNELYLAETRNSCVEAVKHVHYDDLVADPAAAVEEICRWIGEPFDATKLSNWQATTTHILGGNPAVLMQLLGQSILPENYLGGKYAAFKGRIFVDRGWDRDAAFLQGCMDAYRRSGRRLDRVIAALGYGGTRRMIDECTDCLTALGGSPEAKIRSGVFGRVGSLFGSRRAA